MGRRINEEYVIKRYKLLNKKHISNKDALYDTVTHIQYLGIT